MLLHERLQEEGLLSPCTTLVYPRVEINQDATDAKEVSKEATLSKLQVYINETQLKEENETTKDTWTVVKNDI